MRFERVFTEKVQNPAACRFVQAGSAEAPLSPALTVPDHWSLEAAEALLEALCLAIPLHRKSVEENTVPSWLWRHRPTGPSPRSGRETSALDIFGRIANAAAYRGWKAGLWEDETAATIFRDELLSALLDRRIVFAPRAMARMGLDWAYGAALTPSAGETKTQAKTAPRTTPSLSKTLLLQNDTIDTILRQTEIAACEKWAHFFKSSVNAPRTTIAFADTIAQWGALAPQTSPVGATLNLLSFRNADASIDAAALKQACRIATLTCELFYDTLSPAAPEPDARPLRIALGNLAPTLMSLGLAYDSEAARATAAALAAIVTGSAAATSARLAERLGACAAFTGHRETTLRALSNRVRAAFDEKTDYDRLAIVPQTIGINSGADLVLIAAARFTAEEALHLATRHGLRHLHLTAAAADPALAPLLDSAAAGVMPEASLSLSYEAGAGRHEQRLTAAARLGLDALGLEADDRAAIEAHILGRRTLKGAPAISWDHLRQRGLGQAQIERLEAALKTASHLRHVMTPWTIGADFCRTALGLEDAQLRDPDFDLPAALGFTPQEMEIASGFCCGHHSVKGVSELDAAHIAVFETERGMPHEAVVRMAAAVQGFVTDDVSLSLAVPENFDAPARAALVLRAWEMGMKSLTLVQPALAHRQARAVLANEAEAPAPLLRRKTPALKTRGKPAPAPAPAAAAKTAAGLRSAKPRAPRQAIGLKRASASLRGQSRKSS